MAFCHRPRFVACAALPSAQVHVARRLYRLRAACMKVEVASPVLPIFHPIPNGRHEGCTRIKCGYSARSGDDTKMSGAVDGVPQQQVHLFHCHRQIQPWKLSPLGAARLQWSLRETQYLTERVAAFLERPFLVGVNS